MTKTFIGNVRGRQGEKGDPGDASPEMIAAAEARAESVAAAILPPAVTSEIDSRNIPGQVASQVGAQVTPAVLSAGVDAAVAALAGQPTVVAAAASAVTTEIAGRNLVERHYADSGSASGGFRGENGRGTELMVDATGRIVSTTIDSLASRLAARGFASGFTSGTDAAAGGYVGENGRATDLTVDGAGRLIPEALSRIADRIRPFIIAVPREQQIDVMLSGERRLRDADGVAFVSRADLLAAFGDSLTAGWPTQDFTGGQPSPLAWPGQLDADWAGTVYNGGVTGQSADEIAIRQGGYSLTVAAVTIPASGAVSVTAEQVFGWRVDRGWSCVGSLGGVPGTLSRSSGGTALLFTRTSNGDPVVLGAGARFISAQGEEQKEAVQVIFAGRNDIGYASPAGDIVDRVVAATVAMVERSGVRHRRTLLFGTITATGETSGSNGHAQVTEINRTLASIYPAMFYDLRAYLVHQAIHDLGIEPTATDISRMNGDTLPPSIMAVGGTDAVHYSVATAGLVKAQARTQLDTRDWII